MVLSIRRVALVCILSVGGGPFSLADIGTQPKCIAFRSQGREQDPTNVHTVLLSAHWETANVQKQIVQSLRQIPNLRTVMLRGYSSPWIRDWFPTIQVGTDGNPETILAKPFTEHGWVASLQVRERMADWPEFNESKLVLDWGHVIFDANERAFLSDATIGDQNGYILDDPKPKAELTKRLTAILKRDVVFLPGLRREPTGHADMFLSYVGKNRFLLADSRSADHAASLRATEDELKRLGYEVHRVLNAGPDDQGPTLSYTNSLIVGNHALVPVYSDFFRKDAKRQMGGFVNLINRASLALAGWMPPHEKTEAVAKFASDRQAWLEWQARVENDDRNALATFAAMGFKVHPIRMDQTVYLKGAVHCLTRCLSPEAAAAISPAFFEAEKRWYDRLLNNNRPKF